MASPDVWQAVDALMRPGTPEPAAENERELMGTELVATTCRVRVADTAQGAVALCLAPAVTTIPLKSAAEPVRGICLQHLAARKEANGVRKFVAFLESLNHEEVADGDMILVDEDAAWICQTGDDERDRMYPLGGDDPRPLSLGEVLGYDDTPEDRNPKSFERMWTTTDLATLANRYLDALRANASLEPSVGEVPARSLTRGLILPADPAAEYVLMCPGWGSDNRGKNSTAHTGGCCTIFESWPEIAQEQAGPRVPKTHIDGEILAALEQERQQEIDAAAGQIHGGR